MIFRSPADTNSVYFAIVVYMLFIRRLYVSPAFQICLHYMLEILRFLCLA